MSQHIAKRWLKHTLKWLNWTLLIPTAVLSAALFILLYTSAGLSVNLWLAQHLVSGFNVQDSEGSVLGGHTLHNLSWHNDTISLTVEHSQLQLNNRCFLRFAVCIEQLSLDGLQLDIADSDTTPEKTDSTTGFWLPFSIDVTQLQLNNSNVKIGTSQLHWQQFNSGALLWGNKVQLSQPHWQQVQLTLTQENTAAVPTDHKPFNYQAPKLSDISLPFSLFIDRFRLTDFTLQQSDPVSIDELAFSLQILPQQINLTQLDLTTAQTSINASAQLHSTGAYPLKAEIRSVLKTPPLQGQRLNIALNGDLSSLQVNAYATGQFDAELSLWLDLLDNTLPLKATLQAKHLRWPVNGDTGVELQQFATNVTGHLDALEFSSQFQLSGMQLPEATVQLTGHSSLSGMRLQQLNIAALGGQITSQLTLDWQQALTAEGSVQLQQINPGVFWPDYQAQLAGDLQFKVAQTPENGWQLAVEKLQLNGQLRDYLLAATGSLNAADLTGNGDIRLNTPGIIVSHGQNQLNLSGTLANHWQLTLDLDMPDLAQSVAGANGNINAQVNVSGERQTPALTAALTGADLQWQDATLRHLSLDGALTLDNVNNLNVDLTLQAQQGYYQQHDIDQLTLTVKGSELQHQLTLLLASPVHNADIVLSGSLERDKHWRGNLQSATLDSLPGVWQLTETAALDYQFSGETLTIQPHCWQQLPTRLCAISPLRLSKQQIDLDITLQQFALENLSQLLPAPLDLQGIVDATLSTHWQKGQQPEATLSLNAANGIMQLRGSEPLILPWTSGNVIASLKQDTLNTQLKWQFDDSATLQTEAVIANVQSDARTVQGNLKLQQFSLTFLQPLLQQDTTLSGLLSSDLRFSGALTEPLLDGQLNLSKLSIVGKQAPLDIADADVTLTFSGQHATVAGQLTTDKGQIDLTGNAQWPTVDDWRAELNIKGDALRVQVPQATLQLVPDLTLAASPGATAITGTVKIPFARINIDSLPQNAVGLSDDVVLLDTQLQPIPTESQNSFAVQSDIRVDLGSAVQLSAFGLQTRLSGSLRVRQQPGQQANINGDVSLQDGTFRAYGQDLLIRRGKMSFNGPADQPYLNIEAIRNPANIEDDVIAGVRVTGPADEPVVTIFSEPNKPQANTLAYLLMGRDIGSDSGNSSAALTTSLIGMSLSSSGALVGELGEAFGVRDLTLDTAGAGDNAQVTVSGYLSRDLQVKYGYGIFNALGEFTLRYRLARNLYLEAVNSLDNAVDLLYKFEFD